MIQFYAPELTTEMRLGPEESHHCVRVLRKRAGDIIYVADGRGLRAECRILNADAKAVEVEIISQKEIEKSWSGKITLAVAPTKNADRMAWLIEKATEIGVDRIIFIQCRNSERKNLNIERLRRNAISAMNQSLKTRLPEIEELQPLDNILSLESDKFFGYCDEKTTRVLFVSQYRPGNDVVIAIGPEGDFTPQEVESLQKNGFQAVTFGNERLRTETAALYGVTAVHVMQNIKNN